MTLTPDPAEPPEPGLPTAGAVDLGALPAAVDTDGLTQVLNEFSATVTGDFSVHDILRQLALAATRVLKVDGAGVMTPSPSGDLLRMAFSSSGPVRELEGLQESLQEGPCRSCHTTGTIVNIADLRAQGAWPEYRRHALDLGLRAVAAIPLRARGRGWGVLDLYREAPVALGDAELAAASTLANLATSYLVVTADRDIARAAQRELAHRAMHDPLTGLPARWVFHEQLNHALAQLGRNPGHVGILFIDLDGLKYVNDTFGHPAGDRLIRTSVERIRAALRPADILARLGGDEFAVLLEQLAVPEAAGGIAQRILDELAAPYRPDGHTIQPSASVGIAVTDDPDVTGDMLISQADTAMYRAKRAGHGRCETFDPVAYAADRAIATSRERLTSELEGAFRRGELELHYQPIFDLTTFEHSAGLPGDGSDSGGGAGSGESGDLVYAVEALVRWRHPRRGLLTAYAFIDAAVRSGLIGELGTWVLDAACRQMIEWDLRIGAGAPQRVFVNVSTPELTGPGLTDRVADILSRTGLEPSRLTLEITESGLFTKPQATSRALDALQRLGCRFAIDDFGTGYSSLSRLVDIPGSTLKVDQSFTRDVSLDADAAAVVSAVLSLGSNLGRTVIVEGVETEDTLRTLRSLGATHGQGFHLGLVSNADDLTKALQVRPQPARTS